MGVSECPSGWGGSREVRIVGEQGRVVLLGGGEHERVGEPSASCPARTSAAHSAIGDVRATAVMPMPAIVSRAAVTRRALANGAAFRCTR